MRGDFRSEAMQYRDLDIAAQRRAEEEMMSESKAPSAGEFCWLVAEARRLRLAGWWEGSAYCHHPCGVVRDGIIYTNEWSTHDYCSADVMLDPTSPIAARHQDSRYNGDPSCRPVRGGVLRVYSTGHWTDDNGPWRARIIETLSVLRDEVEQARKREEEERKRVDAQRAKEHAETVECARAAIARAEGKEVRS